MNSLALPENNLLTVNSCRSAIRKKMQNLSFIHGGEFRLGRAATGMKAILDPFAKEWSEQDQKRTGRKYRPAYVTISKVRILADRAKHTLGDAAVSLLHSAFQHRTLKPLYKDQMGHWAKVDIGALNSVNLSSIASSGHSLYATNLARFGNEEKVEAWLLEEEFDDWLKTHVRLEEHSFDRFVGDDPQSNKQPPSARNQVKKTGGGRTIYFEDPKWVKKMHEWRYENLDDKGKPASRNKAAVTFADDAGGQSVEGTVKRLYRAYKKTYPSET